MQGYTEITQSELSRYAPNFLEALEAVCESPAFRTSPKSCEFLRHIVHSTLNGNTDVLKERLIGMTLLGREATYDTGSDAGVRVRANDVRKRLVSYRKEEGQVSSFTFDLPSGSYVPRFYTQTTQSLDTAATDKVERYETDVPLSLQHLAAPTVIALFLCVICLRWQIAQEHPFTTFWQNVFQGHSVHLYLPHTERSGNDQLVAIQEVRDSAPLLNLAGQFHSQLNLSGDSETKEGDVLISIGTPFEINAEAGPSQSTVDDLSPTDTRRLTIIDTTDGRRIFDRAVSKMYPTRGNSAALLTISNSPTRSISIDGTDEASIGSLVRLLCERDTFPEGLVDSMADGTTSQMFLSMAPGSQPVIFRDSPSEKQANSGKTQ